MTRFNTMGASISLEIMCLTCFRSAPVEFENSVQRSVYQFYRKRLFLYWQLLMKLNFFLDFRLGPNFVENESLLQIAWINYFEEVFTNLFFPQGLPSPRSQMKTKMFFGEIFCFIVISARCKATSSNVRAVYDQFGLSEYISEQEMKNMIIMLPTNCM